MLFTLLICSASLADYVHAAPEENGTCPSGAPAPTTTMSPEFIGCPAPGGQTCPYYDATPGSWGNPQPYGNRRRRRNTPDGGCNQQCPYETYEGLSFDIKRSAYHSKSFLVASDPAQSKGACVDFCVEECLNRKTCRSYSVHINVVIGPLPIACDCYLHDKWICDGGSNCQGKWLGEPCSAEVDQLSCVISAVCRPEPGYYDNVDC